jgi:hypothetical protein
MKNLDLDRKKIGFYVYHDAKTSLEKITLFYLDLQNTQEIDQIIKYINQKENLENLPIDSLLKEKLKNFSKRILEENPDRFVFVEQSGRSNGYYALQYAAKILIPEEIPTVDVIELYMYAIFKSIGIPEINVHFIDDWIYHINSGEIHCGTVAERSFPLSITPQVYSEVWEKMNQYESNTQYVFTYDPKQ